MRRADRLRAFADAVGEWYAEHKRTLPWRDLAVEDPTQHAYFILVSEVMLQQTQVPRVIVIYKRFLERFPTLRDLAGASNRDMILVWRGMGYNSRALRLRDAARAILERFQGIFPSSMEDLLSIKGIGSYTAAAIRNFAFGLPTPCLDTNIRRILHRVFVGPEKPDGAREKDDESLLKMAREVLEATLMKERDQGIQGVRRNQGAAIPLSLDSLDSANSLDSSGSLHASRSRTAQWHGALMDFGSLVCTKRSPRCAACPLAKKKLCKAAFRVQVPIYRYIDISPLRRRKRSEPGREVAGKFVPNRIFRGRIIEELRDADRGLTLTEIGEHVCIDWSPRAHRAWMRRILEKLKMEALIARRGSRFVLRD